jgi:hypothetical protein
MITRTETGKIIADLGEKICAFSYVLPPDNPIVCQMGFIWFEDFMVLHTDTTNHKWAVLRDFQKVCLSVGRNHLKDYLQVFGIVKKVGIGTEHFSFLEKQYLNGHPSATEFIDVNNGLLIVSPSVVRMAKVSNGTVEFTEYEYADYSQLTRSLFGDPRIRYTQHTRCT